MKLRTEYLSHEELKAFISEIEQTDMVAAPPDVAEHILSTVTGEAMWPEHREYHENAELESSLFSKHKEGYVNSESAFPSKHKEGHVNSESAFPSKHKEGHVNSKSDLLSKHKECHVNAESALDLKCKKKEYRNYCFRVWTSVAAAVAMIFLFSKVVSLQPMQEDYVNQYNKKSVFAAFSESNYIFGREDKLNVFKQMED